jgi:hypothetical protein
MDCARRIKDLLGPDLGGVIVDPLLDLYMDGRTFALFPYCPPLSDRRLVWPIQRRFVRSHVLTWLRRVTQATQRPVSESQRREAFIDPLNAIADDDRFSRQMRQGVEKAAERLQAGEFQPRFVIAHNDLWKGNILLPPSARDAQSRRHRFVVVDWPAARTDGYAFYDLLRLADSLRISRRRLTGELRAHCRVLECSIRDATAYLLAGLAVLGENLGYFDPHRYVAMSEQCFIRLQDAVRE